MGTPAAALANETPNPIAVKVPSTLAKNTTTAILHFRDKLVFCCINPTKLSKYFETTTDAPNRNGRMRLLNT